MNKSLRTIPYLLLACVALYNLNATSFGQQESTSTQEKPQLNFKGTLTDSSGQTFQVENITISGLYKNIPLYAVPAEPEMKPEDNVSLVNLAEIEELKSAPYNGHKMTFNGRPYNKIVVKLKNNTENDYLVEASRKVYCDIAINKNTIEKRLAFDALKDLVITNYSNRDDKELRTETKQKTTGHERECAQAGQALHRLNEEVQKVSGPQKNVILELVDSVRNWVGTICSASPEKE